jgi:hypothetical protein
LTEREALRRAKRIFGARGHAIKAGYNGKATCMIGVYEWNGIHVYGVGDKWEQAVLEAEMESMDGSQPRQKFWYPLVGDLYEKLEDALEEDDMHTHGDGGDDER